MNTTTLLSKYQRMETASQMSILIAIRISISLFINTAILIILVEVEVRDRVLLVDLVKNIFVIFLASSFMPPLVNMFSPQYLLKLMKRKEVMDYNRNRLITQMEAHKVFDGPALLIHYKYSYIYKTLLITAFYIPLQPLLALISLTALAFNYIVEKYLLVNRY